MLPEKIITESLAITPHLEEYANNPLVLELVQIATDMDIHDEIPSPTDEEIPIKFQEIAFNVTLSCSDELRAFIDTHMLEAARAIVLGLHLKAINTQSEWIVGMSELLIPTELNRKEKLFLSTAMFVGESTDIDPIEICKHHKEMLAAINFGYNNIHDQEMVPDKLKTYSQKFLTDYVDVDRESTFWFMHNLKYLMVAFATGHKIGLLSPDLTQLED